MNKEEFKKEVGDRLKALRQSTTQEGYAKFAIHHDIEKNTLLNAESGKNITIETLYDLLQIHKISFEEFFKGL